MHTLTDAHMSIHTNANSTVVNISGPTDMFTVG